MGISANPRLARLLWIGSCAVVVGWAFAELLPALFGTGHEAGIEWGFIYVSMKFVLLPSACLAILGLVLVGAVAGIRGNDSRRALAIASAAFIPAVYLIVLIVAPLPFAGSSR